MSEYNYSNRSHRDENGNECWSNWGYRPSPAIGIPCEMTAEQAEALGKTLAPLFAKRFNLIRCQRPGCGKLFDCGCWGDKDTEFQRHLREEHGDV